MPLTIDRLYHTGVVIRDLEKVAAGYAELFGIDTWSITNLDAELVHGAVAGRRDVRWSGRIAVGRAPWGDEFWLIEPGKGESSYKYRQATHGQGIHHLNFRRTDPAGLAETIAEFDAIGAPVAQRYAVDEVGEIVEFDTRKLLGGYYLQVLVSEDPGTFRLPTHDTWHLGDTYRRPEGVGPLAVPQGIQHFGVVVHDLLPMLDNYSIAYGIPEFRVMNWRTEEGSLEQPTNNGQPVEHEYFAATSSQIANFSFEVVQPTLGPSHYKEDFLQIVGEGIHHLNLVGIAEPAAWPPIRDWMASIGVPVCMSGTLAGGFAQFFYLDTRRKLGGFSVECFGVDPTCDMSSLKDPGPFFAIDFKA